MICSPFVRWSQVGLVLLASQVATAAMAGVPNGMLMAQVIPDDTLENEGSLFIDGGITDRIEGGATRGENLFHSFQEFNINTGQEIYFANPVGIENILSRVTGTNLSEIDGLLGVDGTANLFLLNPNGITFGPNAELDIRGSFTASTADTYQFEGAAAPVDIQGTEFLTMSVPLGVQRGVHPKGNIFSTGNLETGQDLTLLGDQLYLEGQVIAGEDLTLQANDTVTIRDTPTDVFIARSGDALTVQGDQGIDIWTLQHLEQTPFISGGNLALISDGAISGDAHFESGGSLQFLTLAGTPGNFVSFYDPIISANGNVVFGNYEGVALKVEATGSIRAGNIRITGPDTTLTADGSGSDEDLLASSRAVILRAGLESVGNPLTTVGIEFEPASMVEQLSGSIVVSRINTSDNNGGDGGPIILETSSDINISGRLISSSASPMFLGDAKGGDINISSKGDINISGGLTSFSFVSSAPALQPSGRGGNIILSSGGNIDISGSLFSSSASKGGDITLFSEGGINISGDLTSDAFSLLASGNGEGGRITLSSGGGINVSGFLNSSSSSFSDFRSPLVLSSGNGGDIILRARTGNINVSGRLNSSSFSTSDLSASSGDGGDIMLRARTGNINVSGRLNSFSSSFSTSDLSSSSGDGGDIMLQARKGMILGDDNAQITTLSAGLMGGMAGESGTVTLEANNAISDLTIVTLSSTGPSGNVEIHGRGENTEISNLNLTTSAQLEIQNPQNSNETISINIDDIGQSGNTDITAAGDLLLNNVKIQGSANGGRDAGTVTIIGLEKIEIKDTQLLSNTNISSSGNGGSVIVTGLDSITIDNSLINTDTDGRGRAGNISILTPLLISQNGARVTAETSSLVPEGIGGTIEIESDQIYLSDNNTEISVSTSRSAPGGSIVLQPNTSGDIEINTISDGPQISASTARNSSGTGGNITIQNAEVAKLDNTELLTRSDGSGRAGDINVQNVDVLLMRRGSLIQAGASSTGSGGNVDIDAGFVVTVPNENNDILANAKESAGGNIDITANRIIGFNLVERFSDDLRDNNSSDISARSEFDVDGEVSINNLFVDPNQGLNELPTNLVDPANRIAQGCRAAQTDQPEETSAAGDFIITGRGGQSSSPANPGSSDITPLDDFGPIDTQTDATSITAAISETLDDDPPKELKDSQAAIMTESGDVFLVASDGWNASISCSALR